jgi:restriction system protein
MSILAKVIEALFGTANEAFKNHRTGELQGLALTLENEPKLREPTLQQLNAAVEELSRNGSPGFLILEYPGEGSHPDFTQAAGGGGTYMMEWRENYSGQRFSQWTAGRPDCLSTKEVAIRANGRKYTVMENEILTTAHVRTILAAFAQRKGRPANFTWRDITEQVAGNKNSSALEIERAKAKIARIVAEHLETLARRRLALVRVDHYGIVEHGEWNKEVLHFIDKVISPQLTREEAAAIAAGGDGGRLNQNPIFRELIEDRVRLKADEIKRQLAVSDDLTPEQFELWCSRTLTSSGWKTSTTRRTGDQGADVLAEKDGVRIILQCKLYSAPVGNKAVQEAFAAQRHYFARAAAVVTNAEYTNAARGLANTTGVFLLHHSDLIRLDDLLGER